MGAPTKLIDYAAMVKQFAGDKDLFERFASKFLNNFGIHIAKIDLALQQNDRPQLKTLIHSYKNALCNFHANGVYEKIVEMEKLAVTGSIDLAKKLFEEVKSGSKEIAEEIKALQRNSDPMNID